MFLRIWKKLSLLKSIKALVKNILFLNHYLYDLIKIFNIYNLSRAPSLLQFIKFKIFI